MTQINWDLKKMVVGSILFIGLILFFSSLLNNNLNHLEINNTKVKSDSTFYLQLSKKFKIIDYGIKSKLNFQII